MDVRFQMVTEIEELHKRVDKIEKQKNQEVLALVEILSNATFFGEIKKANCEYAKNEQCSFFTLEGEAKNKMPIASNCRIKQCKEPTLHCHIELSNISCTLCQKRTTAWKHTFLSTKQENPKLKFSKHKRT